MSKFAQQLAELQAQNQYRRLPDLQHQGKFIRKDDRTMLNMSSNDYLGLASNGELQRQFLAEWGNDLPPFTSSSSRLLTGNFPIYGELEQLIAQRFGRESCLLFNSGYHANIGILPAVADSKTLIVADKLVHASIIDGIRLAGCEFVRFRHNDLEHLETLIQKNLRKSDRSFEQIIIVTESVFSMDGDVADLPALVQLKQRYDNVLLYVDEAHAIGVYGEQGLGMAEQFGCVADIDFLVGTFGKALASMGAYVVCDQVMKDYLINKMRPLIFSTALPPFNVAWSYFLFNKLPELQAERQHLAALSQRLRQAIDDFTQQPMPSSTHIVPFILGDNARTLAVASALQQQGFYCLPIRPPTVPQGTSRVRLSLTADMEIGEIERFVECLATLK